MKITYDKSADCMYIYFSDLEIEKTVHVSDNINVDIDSNGFIRGLEIIYVSEYLQVADFNHISFQIPGVEGVSLELPQFAGIK